MKLGELKAGEVFEYVNQYNHCDVGVFRVLDRRNCYLKDWVTDETTMIVHLARGQVCKHAKHKQVILLSESGEKIMSTDMKENMGHFINWKFGVPVKVFAFDNGQHSEGRLTRESDKTFSVYWEDGGHANLRKISYYYELIPYGVTYCSKGRFPVCQTPRHSAYCNSGVEMEQISSCANGTITRIPDPPIVTLQIGDKTIELSPETADKLRKELGA